MYPNIVSCQLVDPIPTFMLILVGQLFGIMSTLDRRSFTLLNRHRKISRSILNGLPIPVEED